MRRYSIRIKDQDYEVDVQELAANRFHVVIDGQEVEVTLDHATDLAETQITPAIRAPSVAIPIMTPPAESRPQAPPQVPAVEPPGRVNAVRGAVTAPMPGVILSVEVKPGDTVARGQALLTLEAMKMKNTLRAPRDGVVAAVLAQPGQSVRHGDALLQFEETGA